MDVETRTLLRWTLGSALAWAGAFAAAASFRAFSAGASPLEHAGPITWFSLIGFTVGGLVGPLLQGLVERRRGR